MKKFISLVLGILFLSISCSVASAATYNVTDGVQLMKLVGYYTDPNYSRPGTLVSGDVVNLSGSLKIGYDPALSGCSSSYPYDCRMKGIPDGVTITSDPNNPAELWGTERVSYVLSLQGSDNVIVENIKITDHSDCIEFKTCKRDGGYPYGPWAQVGIKASDSTNVIIRNVEITGLANKGIHAGRLKDWTLQNVKIIGNPYAGWDGDIGATNSSNSGFIKFINTDILFSGCAQGYPDTTKIFNCFGQSQAGYGDGIGTALTNGDWYFENVNISYNVSDGLDLLYAGTSGSVIIKGGKFENNAGNQIKSAFSTIIDGAIIHGNCGWFQGSGLTMSGWGDNCRAMGNAISLGNRGLKPSYTLRNLKVTGNGDVLLLVGGSDDGTRKVAIENSKFEGGPQFGHPDTTAFYYADGNTIKPSLQNVQIAKTKDCNQYPSFCVAEITDSCIVTTCNAVEPPCGQTTQGVDNCGNQCTKTGQECSCFSDGSCNAPEPPCGGPSTSGSDNCGVVCTKQSKPCPEITFTTISAFETWLTISSLKTAPVIKGIRTGTGSTTSPYQCYKVLIEKTSCQ